jgi:scyllo-inositol 2-dehydrogenase (NADP+)
MIRTAVVGLGKMGLSHLALLRSHRDVDLVAVCDATGYVLDVLGKYTGLKAYGDYTKLLSDETLDVVIIATPSRFHGAMVRAALERNLHVFCEKPFCLDIAAGAELVKLAEQKRVVNQVGYHNRFVGTFQEARRQLEVGALGQIHHVRAEIYGPVVLRSKNLTWRAQKSEGGGCLYDYACHAIDLLNYLVGPATRVSGTVLNRIFSHDVEDEVYTTLFFPNAISGQLAANWSDESYRKMSVKLGVWGSNGHLVADRQELRIYIRDEPAGNIRLKRGWNMYFTTELTESVDFYLRGDEYSAQIDSIIESVKVRQPETIASFASALATDRVAAMMREDAAGPAGPAGPRKRHGMTRNVAWMWPNGFVRKRDGWRSTVTR